MYGNPAMPRASKAVPGQFVGCAGTGDCAKIGFPAVAGKVPESKSADGSLPSPRRGLQENKEGNDHDATRWRTQSPGAVDADPRAIFRRSARLSRIGDAARRPHGPLVQGMHGRNAGSSATDFSD